MAETWHQRFLRETAETEAAVRQLLARNLRGRELKAEIDQLAQRPWFANFIWLWGPYLWMDDKVVFRPVILAHFSSSPILGRELGKKVWQGENKKQLEFWIEDADRGDDVEVFRRLYEWRLMERSQGIFGFWRKAEPEWRADLLLRARAAKDRTARHVQLSKIDLRWFTIDKATALSLYEIDPQGAHKFILDHLPSPWLFVDKKEEYFWPELVDRAEAGGDREFARDLYRRTVSDERWRKDVLAAAAKFTDPRALDEELESRHPRSAPKSAAEVFLQLVEQRGRDAVPYVLRHASSVFPRWRWYGQGDAKGFNELVELAERRGWEDVWSKLLKTSAKDTTWNATVRKLVEDRGSSEAHVLRRLMLLAGAGAEANFAGWSATNVQPLTEDNALALYRRFPQLLRGPYRMHASTNWHQGYPKLTQAALDANDEELVDFFASRVAMLYIGDAKRLEGVNLTAQKLTEHYSALAEALFVRRAGNALSMIPAYSVWNYDELLKTNALARLFFERSTHLYVRDGRTLRDLLECPQIHVQALAFRALAVDDPKTAGLAAQNVDLLQATLLRPLHRRTRFMAFGAIRKAASHDEATAQRLVQRMREALALPDKRYPKEELITLIAEVLAKWPSLRGPNEQPKVFRRGAAA